MIDFEKLTNLIADKKCMSSDWNEKDDPFVGIYLSDLVDVINQCDSTKWISVGEALPEYEEDVIVTNSYDDYWFAHRSNNKKVIVDEYGFARTPTVLRITHWMHIPELKGGEK